MSDWIPIRISDVSALSADNKGAISAMGLLLLPVPSSISMFFEAGVENIVCRSSADSSSDILVLLRLCLLICNN